LVSSQKLKIFYREVRGKKSSGSYKSEKDEKGAVQGIRGVSSNHIIGTPGKKKYISGPTTQNLSTKVGEDSSRETTKDCP